MQVKSFKRKRNGLYEVSIDDVTYSFYEEIILKYELLLKKDITNSKLNKMLDDNRFYEAYYLSLKLLNRLAKTKEEVRKYLTDKGYSREVVDKNITKLESQGYLNDERYASSYINQQLQITSYGPKKIKNILLKKGISEDICNKELSIYTREKELEKIEKRVNKLIKSNHTKSSLILKQKISINLINEGFSKDLINQVLTNISLDNEEELAKKTYDKIYQKLSKKYSGKELEYKVKQKMYQAGFRN